MPSYPLPPTPFTSGPALYKGDSFTAISAEKPASGVASAQCCFGYDQTGYPTAVDVNVSFASTPGAFEIDVQGSDTDVDSAYQNVPVGAVINAVDSNQNAVAQFSPWLFTFIRLKTKTANANAVNCTATIVRR